MNDIEQEIDALDQALYAWRNALCDRYPGLRITKRRDMFYAHMDVVGETQLALSVRVASTQAVGGV